MEFGAAGQRVVLLQGTRDKAINGPRALAFYDRLTESCEVLTDVRLIRGDFEHWPLLERPGLLAKVLLESLLVEDDDSPLSPF